jgi:hypothetical protein
MNMQISKSDLIDDSSWDGLDDGWDSDDGDRLAAHRIAILQAYFASLGLRESASRTAAQRVVIEVLKTPVDRNDTGADRRLVAVARKWIRDFSESYGFAVSPSQPDDLSVLNWYSRAPSLLAKFPSAFLATPVPGPRRD